MSKKLTNKSSGIRHYYDICFSKLLAGFSLLVGLGSAIGLVAAYKGNYFGSISTWIKLHIAYVGFGGFLYFIIISTGFDRKMITRRKVNKFLLSTNILLMILLLCGIWLSLLDTMDMKHKEYFNYVVFGSSISAILARLAVRKIDLGKLRIRK